MSSEFVQDILAALSLPDMDYSSLLALHIGCVAFIVLAVLWRTRWLRPLAVIAGAVALWLPLFALLDTLGQPNPYPPNGHYKVLSSKLHKETGRFYLFLDTLGVDPTPRVYVIQFEMDEYERFAETASDYEMQVIQLNGGGGDYEVVYVDYQPPDLLKDGVMRGWQTPREDD